MTSNKLTINADVKKLNEKVEKMATEIEATSKQLEESLERLEHRPLDLFQRPNVKNSKGNLSKSTCIQLAVLIAFISIVFAVVAFVFVSKIKYKNDEKLGPALATIDELKEQIAELINKSENTDAFENRVRVIMKNNSLGITQIKEKMDETNILANKTMKDLGSHISATRCASYPCQNGGTCSQNSTAHHCTCVSGFVGANCEISLNATGWFQESNHLWYKLFESKLNHNQSAANCSAAGARLASTGLRNQTVFSSITAYLRTKLNTGVWIGLEKVGGVWEWSDGVKANGAWSNSCVLISRAGLELTGISCNSVKHHLCEQ